METIHPVHQRLETEIKALHERLQTLPDHQVEERLEIRRQLFVKTEIIRVIKYFNK